MDKYGVRILFVLLILVSCAYLGDVAVLHFRKDPTSTVTVHPYTAVPRKDKREEYLFDDPYDQACVNSLFPHRQMPPCWYLRRQPEVRTNL
jgi:hypothetical protein